MEYKSFKETLDNIRAIDTFTDALYKLGVDIINCNVNDSMYNVQKNLFTEIYGKEGYEWIEWYLYEQPHFQKKIDEVGDKPEYHAWDENGNPMDLSSDDKLWEMLEKDYVVGKEDHDNDSMPEKILLPYIYDSTKHHSLIRVEDNKYRFLPAEDWMPISITYCKDGDRISGFDCDGMGTMKCLGDYIGGDKYVINDITYIDGTLYVYIKEAK